MSFSTRAPLVDDNDDAFVLLQHVTRHVRVLGGDHLQRIEQEQDHVGPIDRLERTQYAVLLDTGADLAAPTNTRRIDQGHQPPLVGQLRVDHVTCGAGYFADDRPFLPGAAR